MRLLNSLLAITIDWNRFLGSFQYMGKGMLGIFIVIGILVGCVTLLNKLTTREKKNKDNNENE